MFATAATAQSTQNRTSWSLSVNANSWVHNDADDWPYFAYAGHPCGYRLCTSRADRDRSPSLGPAGAAWVFTRTGGGWRQQGGKLVGTTSDFGGGLWSQGASVALS